MKKALFFILILLVLIPAIWVVVYKFEGAEPEVDIKLPSLYLKKTYEMTVKVTDAKTGLRNVSVSIVQQDKEEVLLEKTYETSGFMGLFSGAGAQTDSFIIPVESWKYGMADGEAVIRVEVSDLSWRGWNKGNLFFAEKKVVIDTKPPKVTVLSKRHNIERGGSGLVIYQIYEENIQSGVRVDDNYFPGHSGMFENKEIHVAFFALDHTQGPGSRMNVVAEDPAGNITTRGFHHYIRDKKFKTDVMNISDGFLDEKIPGFDVGAKEGSFSGEKETLLDKYLFINREIRKANVDKVLSVPADTDQKKHWEGRFLRLKGSQRRAGFADHRIYKFKGGEIDRSTHLGIDLASTAHAEVPAANTGRVTFTGDVGIFGKTVIIDHGFGLASLYSHLNDITVGEQDMVNIGEKIGYTGETGLAGGDHLHFSMIVHNVFVNPVEWWDPAWIKNNITSKIDSVKQIKEN